MKITIEITAKPEKIQELYQVLYGLLSVIGKQKGCRNCSVHRDAVDGEIFILDIEWDGPRALQQFMATVGGAALLGAIDLLGQSRSVQDWG